MQYPFSFGDPPEKLFSSFNGIGSPLSSSSLQASSSSACSSSSSSSSSSSRRGPPGMEGSELSTPLSPARKLRFGRETSDDNDDDETISTDGSSLISTDRSLSSMIATPMAEMSMFSLDEGGPTSFSTFKFSIREDGSSAFGSSTCTDTFSEATMDESEPCILRMPRSFSAELDDLQADDDPEPVRCPPCKVAAIDARMVRMHSLPSSPLMGDLQQPQGLTAPTMLSGSYDDVNDDLAMQPVPNSEMLLPTIHGTGVAMFPCVSVDTVAALLTGELPVPKGYVLLIIDCRFQFEYLGGHIRNAVNIMAPDVDAKLKELLYPMGKPQKAILLFHCEFSKERGPFVMRALRSIDRQRNLVKYPFLDYDQMYLIHGGYKKFHARHPELCDPVGRYVPMLHPDHSSELTECNTAFTRESSRERQSSMLCHRSMSELTPRGRQYPRKCCSLLSHCSLSMSDLAHTTPLKKSAVPRDKTAPPPELDDDDDNDVEEEDEENGNDGLK